MGKNDAGPINSFNIQMNFRKFIIFLKRFLRFIIPKKNLKNSHYKIKVKIDTIKISENTLNIVEVTRVTKVCLNHLMSSIYTICDKIFLR